MVEYDKVKQRPGLIYKTVNHDQMLLNLKVPPLIVNDLDVRYVEDVELLKKYQMTNYDSATFSMVPKCDCGNLVGGYLRGKVCPDCGGEVLAHTEIPIVSNLWIQVLDGVTAFINPIVYNKLSNAFKCANVDVIRWLCDPHYRGAFDENIVIQKLRHRGVKRGYNYFIEHIWSIIDILLEKGTYSSSSGISKKRKELPHWLEANKDNLFSQYLPLPNRLSLITERTPTGTYGEVQKFGGALEASSLITGLKTRISPVTQTVKESTCYRCVLLLASYYEAQYKSSLGRKPGLIRKHICGSRIPFTARNVITSLHVAHEYDELHIPWGMAVGLLRLHLLNKFLRDGYTPNEAMGVISESSNRFNPIIRKYFDELFEESPIHGLPCCFNRNPTLLRGSIQQLRITKIKNRVQDNTINLSVLILGSFKTLEPFIRNNKVNIPLIAGTLSR